MTHANQSTMVISYGCRDEDDEYDSEDERQRGLFGGMLQHNKRASANANTSGGLTGLMEKFSASMTMGNASGDDDDSDDGSVCSKSSVASKASQAFKKLGKKMKGRLGSRSDGSDSDDSDSDSDEEEEEETSDEETSDEEMNDRSISSLVGKSVRKVTGKFTDALRMGRRSDGEDSSDEEEEEDPFAPAANNNKVKKSLSIRAFGFGNMKQDDSQGSSGSKGGTTSSGRRRRGSNEREQRKSMVEQRPRPKGRMPSRCHSTDGSDLPGASGRRNRPLSRSHTSDNRRTARANQPLFRSCTTDNRADMVRAAARAKAKEEFDKEPEWAAPDPKDKRRAQASQAAARTKLQQEYLEPNEAVWSMNVTEKMLEQATNEGIFVPPKTTA